MFHGNVKVCEVNCRNKAMHGSFNKELTAGWVHCRRRRRQGKLHSLSAFVNRTPPPLHRVEGKMAILGKNKGAPFYEQSFANFAVTVKK